jgi:hypothetical protein
MLFALLVLVSCLTGCKERKASSSTISPSIEPQLRKFFSDKEEQALWLVAEQERKVGSKLGAYADDAAHRNWSGVKNTYWKGKTSPEVWSYFRAGREGNWSEMTNLFSGIASKSYQFSKSGLDERLSHPAWQAVNETYWTYALFDKVDPKYMLKFGRDIIDSIPKGSIYFGGTDAGRFMVTFLITNQVKGQPFFVLTQNALADSTYLDYLRLIYGKQFYIPTEQDSSQAYDDYFADAERRRRLNQLWPDETVTNSAGQISVGGPGPIMGINGYVLKKILEKNPNREIYLQELNPVRWTYPHLVPHHLILRLNREPVPQLTAEMVKQDQDFWNNYIAPLIGNWITEQTSVQEICAFAEKVFFNKDLVGFKGDPKYVQNGLNWRSRSQEGGACAEFSELRSTIAEVYAWRKRQAKAAEEKERMVRAADLAFRQAMALCPYHPGDVYRYIVFLSEENRLDDALAVAKTAAKFDSSGYFPSVVQFLNDQKTNANNKATLP